MKKKALVIRFSSIGDIILTTPVLRCLVTQGKYEVHYLTQKKFAHVLEDNIYITAMHTLEGSLIATSKKIRDYDYDVIIDLHKSIRSLFIRLFLFRKVYGFKKLRIKRWMRTWYSSFLSDDRHIALRFLGSLKHTGIDYDGKGLDFFIKKEDHVSLNRTSQKINIGLVPGARHYTKTLPLHLSESIINSFSDCHFHIIGGKFEMDSTASLNKKENVSNHCGTLSLGQSASIIEQCDFVISTDTAMMHIAAALDKKIISIWGGTVPAFGFAPFFQVKKGNSIIIENKTIKCRPCSKSGKSDCPKAHFKCMNDISKDEVYHAIEEYINAIKK